MQSPQTCTKLFYREFIGIWGGDLKNYHRKVSSFEKGTCEDTYDVSCKSVFFNNLSCSISRIWRTSHGISHLMISKMFFLLTNGIFYHLSRKKLDDLHVPPHQGFSQLQMWSNHWHRQNAILLLLTVPRIIDLPLKLDGGDQLRLSLRYWLCQYCSYKCSWK